MRYLFSFLLLICISCQSPTEPKIVSLEVWPEADYRLNAPVALLDSVSAMLPIEEQFQRVEQMLLGTVFQALEDGTPEEVLVRDLSAGQRAFYTSISVRAHVYGPGLVAYFWSSSAHYAEETVKGYRRIGAEELAAGFEELLKTYELNKWKFDQMRFFRNVKNATALLNVEWFDKLYAEHEQNMMSQMVTYIRNNPSEFFQVEEEPSISL